MVKIITGLKNGDLREAMAAKAEAVALYEFLHIILADYIPFIDSHFGATLVCPLLSFPRTLE